MSELNNPIQEVLDNQSLISEVQKAKDKLNWKPYTQRFGGLISTSHKVQYVLPVISVFTGTFFLVHVSWMLPLWITIPISLVPFAVLEVFKNKVANAAFLSYYSNRKKNNKETSMMFVLLVLLALCSVFCSVNGAKSIYAKTDNKDQVIREQYIAKEQAEGAKNDSIVSELKRDKDAFVKANQVFINNKVGMVFNHKMADELKQYEKRIDLAIGKGNAEVIQREIKLDEDLSKAAEESGFNTWVFASIAFIIDLFIMLSVWFPIHASYMLALEHQRITGEKQDFQFNYETLVQLLSISGIRSHQSHLLQPQSQVSQSEVQSPKIGFNTVGDSLNHQSQVVAKSLNSQSQIVEEGLNSESQTIAIPLVEMPDDIIKKGSNYWEKYPHLCSDIVRKKQGILRLSAKKIAAFHGVSKDTFFRVQTSIIE